MLYDELVTAQITKKAQVELAFNISEDELVRFSQCCRYALKLDLKGFAENASSMIAAMTGLFLPVVAQKGLVSPSCSEDYYPALQLINSRLILGSSDVVPEKINVEILLSIFMEPEREYLARIQAIEKLRAQKQFDLQEMTEVLIQKINSHFTAPEDDYALLSSFSILRAAKANINPLVESGIHTPLKLKTRLH